MSRCLVIAITRGARTVPTRGATPEPLCFSVFYGDSEAPQGCDRGAAERRRASRHGEDYQLDFGFGRPVYSYITPGQRSEYAREYAPEYAGVRARLS